ncbi:MAG: hypothetical protein WCL51_14005 [Bacteroidota bacterium]|jgi:hypothetical protein
MSKKILSLFSIIAAISMVVIISCKHDSTPPIIDESTIPAGICFSDDVLPLIQSNCAYSGCHSGSQNPNLSTYADIMKLVKAGDPQASRLYTTCIGSSMPPKPHSFLNLEEVTLIYGWIKQGAPNNTCACDTSIYTYSGAVLPIIKRNCWGCHGTGSSKPYTNWQEISDAAYNIVQDITDSSGNPMPKPPTAKLSDCKITQIAKWYNAGTPNN